MDWIQKPNIPPNGPCPKSACWTHGQCTYRECTKAVCGIKPGENCDKKACLFYFTLMLEYK